MAPNYRRSASWADRSLPALLPFTPTFPLLERCRIAMMFFSRPPVTYLSLGRPRRAATLPASDIGTPARGQRRIHRSPKLPGISRALRNSSSRNPSCLAPAFRIDVPRQGRVLRRHLYARVCSCVHNLLHGEPSRAAKARKCPGTPEPEVKHGLNLSRRETALRTMRKRSEHEYQRLKLGRRVHLFDGLRKVRAFGGTRCLHTLWLPCPMPRRTHVCDFTNEHGARHRGVILEHVTHACEIGLGTATIQRAVGAE